MVASSTLLQPVQIWMPVSPNARSRQIIDFPRRMLSYIYVARRSNNCAAPDRTPPEATDEYLIMQSAFRLWIKESQAILIGQVEAKAAPGIELAKKIVTLRHAFSMNQPALAEALKVSRSTIAALETGRVSNARRHIPRLAKIFNVPTEFFINGMSEQTITMELHADERDLITLYRSLSPETKLTVQRYIERRARHD